MLEANAIQVRIGELCHQFRLPTMGAQSVSRFTAAGHGDALETLLEVLEQEAEDRRQRRIGRLRTASRLPAGKTWETFEHDRVPLALRQQLGELSSGSFVDRGVNVLAFGLPGTSRPMHCAPWATGWWKPDARCSSPRPTGWCRTCSLPSGTWRYRDNYESSTTTAAGRPGVPAPRGRRVRGALHAHRRRYERRMGITSNLASPSGSTSSPRMARRRPSTGWSTTRSSWNSTAQLPHRSGPAAQSETGGEPARIIDARQK